ncbi:MAG: hypothetical protein R3Y53_06085 [Bacillota bacterium]
MNIFRKIKPRQNKSTREEIGAKEITPLGVETYNKEVLVYFLIQPSNIAVLSEANVRSKVNHFMELLKDKEEVECACINSRENFEDNKSYLKERLSEEKNQKVKEILEKDLLFLDRIQIQMSSAREFLLIMRLKGKDTEEKEVLANISRMEKLIKDRGFVSVRADKEDIKRIFAVYFVQNLTQVYFDDYDGERFVKEKSY